MKPTLKTSVKRTDTGHYEFSPEIVEIAVIDRLGKPVWQSKRQMGERHMIWTGVDLYGENLMEGSYMFKVVSADRQEHYLPFIHAN